MANELSVAGPKAYGGLKPSCTIGQEDFAAHDATKAWGDDGGADALTASIAPDVRAYGAEQAKQAVLDYTQNAFADITAINGDACFLLDVSNEVVPYAVGWNLKSLLLKAIAEAENAGDTEALSAIGRMIEQVSAHFRPPVAAAPRLAAPARPVIKGAAKPAGAVRASAHRAASRAAVPPARPAS